ncbi:putative protein kinase-like protein [Trypanosoma rangeli]|uniref:Transmembrane protein n=1 Tax=Trypanosoma rangeli TaxID=5698 RepID=A0A422P0W2_TRYRA|nr:putative protein kinase-like protein [Trypanosoma rangeli]RNF11314.1 putative protein kinase-like protein [Trypanosoma rangeli]|eukprot:RNF11314.1 putative protein kinase-like protein [Trypanosoma rangeli]
MGGQHCCFSHAGTRIGTFAVFLFFFALHVAGAGVRFRGSVYRGLAEETLRVGGATFMVQAVFPIFKGYDEAHLKDLLAEILSVSYVVSEDGAKREMQVTSNSWLRQLPRLMEQSRVEMEENGRTVRLTFHPLSDCVVDEALLVVPCLPPNITQQPHTLGGGAKGEDCRSDNAFVVTPKTLICIDTDRLVQMAPAQYITGNMIEIPIVKEKSAGTGSRIKVMNSNSCVNAVEASISGNEWDEENQVFRFGAIRGGLVTLCYMPFPEALPHVMLEVGETLTIAGPEGVSIEPRRVFSGVEFRGHVFGTNLSEHDELIITAQSCNEFTFENTFLPVFSLFSSTRALFFGIINEKGHYLVCYCREGSNRYVGVATLVVEKDVDAAMKKGSKYLPLDSVTDFYPVSIAGRLQVDETIMLFLKQESFNVSSLVWSGGSIVGQGEINCLGMSTITSQGYEPRTLSFILGNYGVMVIDVPQLLLEGGGAVHNYGHLTIVVAHVGDEGATSIRSRSRNNVVINRGGVIHVIAVEQGPAVLCQTHIMNTKGSLVLSGNLKITEMVIGERAKLVLQHGARVYTSDARLSGTIVLLENSELTLMGDSSLVSAKVIGNRSRIFLTGKSLLLDSIAVTGEVTTDIIGPLAGPSIVLVALCGVIAFGEGSHLNLRRAHLITNTGLAQLIIAGALTADIDSVVLSGNIWIQDNNITVVYGSGSRHRVQKGEESSLVSFAVSGNATLVALDVSSPPDFSVNCDTMLSLFGYVKIDGRFLVRGCVAVPLGGVIGGSVEYLKLPDEAARLMPLLLAANIRLPLNGVLPRGASLILGGEMLLRNGARLNLDGIVMKNAALIGAGTVYVGAQTILSVDHGSRLVLGGGCVINAAVTYVEGLLEADMLLGPLINGSLEIATGGRVKLYSVQTTPCVNVLSASGGVRWAHDLIVECHYYPLPSVSGYFSKASDRKKNDELRRKWFVLPPDMECSEEYLLEEANKLFIVFHCFHMMPHDPPPGVPSTRSMIKWGITFVLLGFMVMQFFLLANGMSWKQWLMDLRKKPPLRLTLSRSEFTLHAMNYVILATLLFNVFQRSMVAIPPQAPLPVGFMSFVRFRSVLLILPHRLINFQVTMRRVTMGTFIWGFTSITLMVLGKNSIRRRLCGKWGQRIMQILLRVEHVLQVFLIVFSFPFRSLVLDTFACNTFLSEFTTCSEAHNNMIVPTISLLLFCFVIQSGRLSAMQLLKCDLRCRLSVLVALDALSLTESGMWKVFSNSSLLLFVSNFSFACLRLLLLFYATPTAYRNINRLMIQFSCSALFAHVCIILHVIRVYLGFAKTCRDGEMYFIVVVTLWIVTVGGSVWYNIIAAQDESATTNNVAIDAIQRSIQQIHSRIQELQYEFLTCASAEERQNVLNATARLNMELLEKQKRYHYEKYRLLGSFYFNGLIKEPTRPRTVLTKKNNQFL